MTLSARDPALAPEIGKYHLIAELARGGMGNVYLAALCGPADFQKLLVVKELKPELCDDPAYVTMFLEEARLAARLVHPNIVQMNEVGSEGGRYHMTMEYLDGRSLARVVRRCAREGGLPVGAHLRVLCDCLLGLHYAHELRGLDGEPLGVVHRDVSPLNVMVTFDGQAKLLDFGIAKAADSSLETQAGVLKGRIAYMAPEQACGAKVDRRADVYSMGVMLWEAAAGRRLWQDMSEVEILRRVLHEGPPRLRDVAPGAPADLDAICARATARDRGDRYPTAAEFLGALERHLARRRDAMTVRQIGEYIGVIFAEERHQMAQLIEERLARAATGPRSGVVRSSTEQPSGSPWGERLEATGSSKAGPLVGANEYAAAMWDDASLSAVRGAGRTLASGVAGLPPAPRARRTGLFALLIATGLGLGAMAASRTAPKVPGAAPPSAASSPVASAIPAPSQTTAATPPAPAIASATAAPARGDLRDGARSTPAVPKQRAPKPQASAAASVAPPASERRPPPVSCDPPYTVDSNGIEHFKAGCL
ncbi:MAG TPA: serine/threonine-protein kinase [Polyangiaceae bacterium]|nr:serine/threonine-protein kinase [Polyangiaceae bacterium]